MVRHERDEPTRNHRCAGVRVITYYLEDVERVGALIRHEFDVDKAVAVDKANDEPDRFGYK